MEAATEIDSQLILEFIQLYWPDIPVTQHLLEHPTSEFVIQFYRRFQEDIQSKLLLITGRSVAPPEVKATTEPIFSLLAFVNKYLNTGDVDGMSLTLTDLYEPTAKRTKVRFKVLVNLLLFFEEKANVVKNIISKRLEQTEDCNEKKEKKERLKEELAKEAEKLACQEDGLQKLQKELEKADLRYENLNKQKADKGRHHAKLQQDLQELVNTYQNKQTLLTNVKTSKQHLNEQVVTEESYRSLIDLKENLVKKCSELNMEIECLGKNLENRKPEVDRFDNINKELHKLNNDCEEIRIFQNSISNLKTQLQISEEKYKKKTEELHNCKLNRSKHRESIKATKEALQSETLKHKTLQDKMQQTHEQFKIELNEEQELQNNVASEKDMLQEKIEELNHRVKEITSDIHELQSSYENTYKNMINSENTVIKNFSNILESIKEALAPEEKGSEENFMTEAPIK